MTTPLIIDTDTAQDDCIAIIAAMMDERADLRAITMVAGNVGFERQVHNAHLTLNVLGKLGEVPIHRGCPRPMVLPWVSAEEVHGDGSGGLAIDEEGLTTEGEHGVDALLRLTAEAPGEISIIAIGPLTNLALAAVKDPSFPARVKKLVIMGGSNNGRGNITPAGEFNFYVDPHAARVVFQAGFDITLVTWDPLTLRDAVFTRDRLAEIDALGTPLSEFFGRVCAATLAFDESVGIPGTTHPDSLCVAVLLEPSIVTSSSRQNVAVECDSALTRGYSAISWGVHGLEPNAEVIEAVDGERFYGYLTGFLATATSPSRAYLTTSSSDGHSPRTGDTP